MTPCLTLRCRVTCLKVVVAAPVKQTVTADTPVMASSESPLSVPSSSTPLPLTVLLLPPPCAQQAMPLYRQAVKAQQRLSETMKRWQTRLAREPASVVSDAALLEPQHEVADTPLGTAIGQCHGAFILAQTRGLVLTCTPRTSASRMSGSKSLCRFGIVSATIVDAG